jgi:hypothetical protein
MQIFITSTIKIQIVVQGTVELLYTGPSPLNGRRRLKVIIITSKVGDVVLYSTSFFIFQSSVRNESTF